MWYVHCHAYSQLEREELHFSTYIFKYPLFITYTVIKMHQKCFPYAVNYFCKTGRKLGVLPYSIKWSDGEFPLPLHGLASDEVFCKMVGQLTGFSHERLVLQVFTCDLLINVLQAHEKGPMAKPVTKWERRQCGISILPRLCSRCSSW